MILILLLVFALIALVLYTGIKKIMKANEVPVEEPEESILIVDDSSGLDEKKTRYIFGIVSVYEAFLSLFFLHAVS